MSSNVKFKGAYKNWCKMNAEYVFEKIVFRKDGGHCMCFTDLTGKRYLTFHQPNRTPDERMKLFLFEG